MAVSAVLMHTRLAREFILAEHSLQEALLTDKNLFLHPKALLGLLYL